MLVTLIIFIAILALLVLVHEFGHFAAARQSGVKVDEFGFGFPPRIFGMQVLKRERLEKVAETEVDIVKPVRQWRFVWGSGSHLAKDGEDWGGAGTIYSLNWIPLGGFVKIKGEDGGQLEDPDSFGRKSIFRRALILAAGVLMNFILAGVLLGIGFGIGLPQSLDQITWGAKVKDSKVEIMSVLEKTPAALAGVQAGDEIIQADQLSGVKLSLLRDYLDAKKGQSVKFIFKRGDQLIEKAIAPLEMSETKKGGIGVALLETGIVSYPWYLAIYKGFEAMVFFAWEVVKALWFLLAGLVRGAAVSENLSGPVGIAVLTGRVARLGFVYLLQFTALLSVNLAVLNFLPFPALDGGRILFLIIEKFRGRPVKQRVEQITHTVGFALLMALVVMVTYRDVIRFSGSFVKLGKRLIGG